MRIEWKRVLLLALMMGLLSLFLRGLVAARCAPEKTGQKAETQAGDASGALVTVYDCDQGKTIVQPLETYALHVAAGEMPASFPAEALKAQAVAARTYTAYHMLHGGCRSHDDADVCTSSACCQAYCTDQEMRDKWGRDYEENLAKFTDAATDTAGEVLLYDGEPIEALYHSASGGRTENAEDVYSAAVPYLRSVMSTAESGTARLTGEKRWTKAAFCALINEKWPDARLAKGKLASQLEIVDAAESGRVQSLRLGGVTVTGRQARGALGLDSALFTFAFTDAEVIFSTKGFGHGVGMSQTGANAMALGGKTYREILLYYYTDVTLGSIVWEEGE